MIIKHGFKYKEITYGLIYDKWHRLPSISGEKQLPLKELSLIKIGYHRNPGKQKYGHRISGNLKTLDQLNDFYKTVINFELHNF